MGDPITADQSDDNHNTSFPDSDRPLPRAELQPTVHRRLLKEKETSCFSNDTFAIPGMELARKTALLLYHYRVTSTYLASISMVVRLAARL